MLVACKLLAGVRSMSFGDSIKSHKGGMGGGIKTKRIVKAVRMYACSRGFRTLHD